LDSLIEAGRSEKDPARRKEIYAKAQEIEVKKDVLLVPVRNLEHVAALSKNVQDFWISPSGYLMINEVKIH
jgi:peptide/nickel transport system substrate-binding protein